MPSYTLVGTPFSTFTRTIALALRYKNIPFTQLETKPHEELAKQYHPFGYLPSLVIINGSGDDEYDEGRSDSKDIALRESQAIARYIDRIEPRPSLHDDEGQMPEKMWEFVSFCTSFGFPRIEGDVVKVRLGMSDAPRDDIPSALKPGLERLSEFITIIESLMSQDHSHFTFGSHPTWADLFLYPMVADLEATPEAHALTPRLRVWSEKMKTLPAVRNTVEGTLAAQSNV